MLKKFLFLCLLSASSIASAENIKFSNVTLGIDASGSSYDLFRVSESTFRGTILFCEGGCKKRSVKATLSNNILTTQIFYNSQLIATEKFRWDNFRLYPMTKEQFSNSILYNCVENAKHNTYSCLNHMEFILK